MTTAETRMNPPDRTVWSAGQNATEGDPPPAHRSSPFAAHEPFGERLPESWLGEQHRLLDLEDGFRD